RLSAAELSTSQVDALKSLAGFGSADAARSLMQLLGPGVEMGATRAVLYHRDGLDQIFSPEPAGIGVRFRAEGGARVRLLVQFTRAGAGRVAEALVGERA